MTSEVSSVNLRKMTLPKGYFLMFQIWGKQVKGTRITKQYTVSIPDNAGNRTKKVFRAMTELCREFDLQEPIWLDINIREFQQFSFTRFHQDNFIEPIEFDYLEFRVLKEE